VRARKRLKSAHARAGGRVPRALIEAHAFSQGQKRGRSSLSLFPARACLSYPFAASLRGERPKGEVPSSVGLIVFLPSDFWRRARNGAFLLSSLLSPFFYSLEQKRLSRSLKGGHWVTRSSEGDDDWLRRNARKYFFPTRAFVGGVNERQSVITKVLCLSGHQSFSPARAREKTWSLLE